MEDLSLRQQEHVLGVVLIARYFLSDLNQIWSFLADFHKKIRKTKFYGNPSVGSRANTCG